MKKAIYLLAATAFLASCNQEVLIDTPDMEPTAPRAIGFETFADKATRADANNSNALNFFYPTFNVYGWKTVGSEVTCVFNNIPVEYFTANAKGTVVYKNDNQKPSDEWTVATPFDAGWYYENIRYWDKMASKYQYSAYAPASATDAVNCASNGLITIGTATAPVTVDDKNLMATPATKLAYKGFDLDYMTARATAEPSTDAADMSTPVALNFSHLQAKLNIRIKLAESMTTAQDIVVKTIQVHNLGDKGYYTNEANATGTVSGWTLYTEPEQTPAEPENTPETVDEPAAETPDTEEPTEYVPAITGTYQLNGATAGTNNFNGYYVLEQLIIPQTIKKYIAPTPEATADVVTLPVSLIEYDEACVYVEYTIGEETFKSYTPLANIFSTDPTYNFLGGKQYTLNITIGPKPINFTAVVTPWADAIDGNLPMD